MPNFLTSHALEMVRGLAFASLFGLLLAIGLQTSIKALRSALKRVRLGPVVLSNFFLIPILAATLILQAELDQNAARALMLLACAPFAPVVPLFVRMALGHQALATGLTALFPIFSALLTPCAVALGFWLTQDTGNETPSALESLALLSASITLPLALGMTLQEYFPRLSSRIQKPMEWLSEVIGILSLGYLATLETSHLAAFSLKEAGPYLLFYEAAFVLGLILGQGPLQDRLVIGFGTANRNIGLAILLAAALADDSDLLGEVLAQSLLMLAIGLIHVAIARAILSSDRFRRRPGGDPSTRS